MPISELDLFPTDLLYLSEMKKTNGDNAPLGNAHVQRDPPLHLTRPKTFTWGLALPPCTCQSKHIVALASGVPLCGDNDGVLPWQPRPPPRSRKTLPATTSP